MNMYHSLFTLASVLGLVGYIWLTVVAFKRSVPWGLLVLLFSPITAIIFALTNWFDARKPFLIYIASFVLMIGSAYALYNQVSVAIQQIVQRQHSGELKPDEARRLMMSALLGHAIPQPAKAAPELAPAPAQGQAQAASEASKPAMAETKADTKPSNPAETKAKTVAEVKTVASSEQITNKKAASVEKNPVKQKPVVRIPNPDQAQPDPLAQKRKKVEPNTIVVSLDKMSSHVGHYFIITLKTGNQQRGLLRKVDDKRLYLDRKLYGGNFEYKVRKDQIKSIQMLKKIPEER
jgi:hypothetical protein